jgi:hypothetical protein
MDELLKLARENNFMLRYICTRLNNSTEDDMMDMMRNIIANLSSSKLLDAYKQ